MNSSAREMPKDSTLDNGPARTLVLGLGNPILGDDGVGWRVAEAVRTRLGPARDDVEVDCASLGGLALMERILGYSHIILIDAIETENVPVGQVCRFPLNALRNPMSGHTGSAHDASLITALQTAEAMGQKVPRNIEIVAIETRQTNTFSEELTPPIEQAAAAASGLVIEAIGAAG